MSVTAGKGWNLPESAGFSLVKEKADAFRRIFL